MTFDSMDDLKAYAASPAHEEYIKNTAKQTGGSLALSFDDELLRLTVFITEKMIYDIES